MRFSRHAWWLYLAVMVPITVAYLAGPLNAGPVFNVIGFSGAAAVVAGVRIHRPAARWAWYLIALGLVLFVAGDVLAYNYKALFGGALPFPSIADPVYLAVYPVTVAGLLLLIRRRNPGRDWASLIDAMIVTIGVALLSWVFLMAPYAHDHTLHLGTKLVSIAYPLGDILLLGVAVRMAVGAGRRSAAYYMVIGAIVAVLATDSVYGWILLHGSYHPGDPLDGGWIVYYLLWGAAALHPSMTTVSQAAAPKVGLTRVRILAIAAAALAAPVIEVVDASAHGGADNVVVGCAAIVLFALVVLRMVGLARESAALAESVLRAQSEAHLSALVQHSSDVILVMARDTTIEYASPSVHQVLGYEPQDLTGRPLVDYIAEQDRTLFQPALAVLLASAPETSHAFEFRIRHRDGRLLHTECLAGNLLSNPAVGGIVVNLRDTTERNRVAAEVVLARDQAVEASNMKSAFLSNVSHEIRTPMNGVIGMNDLLLGTNLDDEQRGYAEQVARSSEHMLTIITDILDIAKIEAGKIELHIAEFDLRETVEQACMPAILEAQAKGLQLHLRIDPRLPQRVRGDAARVHQILLNLVYNAVKFTEHGTINVNIAPPDSESTDIIRFEVTDTGIGIQPAQLERMFEPFVQADVSMTRQYGGSGLGLAIAKDLVERMHGTINASSKPGSGSTFAFEIELPHAAELLAPTSLKHDADVTPWPVASTAPLVLVAEDNPVNQVVAVRLLERCGFHAHAVNGGREALEALSTTRYDAVLMDCQMPEVDGYQATKELRRREHGTHHTPVIAMTAHAMPGDRERCLEAGMDDYLTKPMRHTDLADALRRWIPTGVSTSNTPEPLVSVDQ